MFKNPFAMAISVAVLVGVLVFVYNRFCDLSGDDAYNPFPIGIGSGILALIAGSILLKPESKSKQSVMYEKFDAE